MSHATTDLMQSPAAESGWTPRRLYRVAATAEMVTWTLLLAGMALKYTGVTEVGVRIAGLCHGAAFLAYLLTNVFVALNQGWRARTVLLGFATTFVPYATLPYDRWLERRGMLEGPWRKPVPGEDAGALERIRGFALGRPWLAIALAVVVLGAVMAFLLWLGPPTGWATRFAN
ncbi:DUF3817 domain-containing protein [Mariniluteicoccus flavus]